LLFSLVALAPRLLDILVTLPALEMRMAG
jgi:hypothetical protein